MLRSEKGFSLVQVMIVAGLLGGLSLVFMQLMKNMGQAQNFAQSKSDEIELKSSIRMILSNEKFCRVSLAGDGASGSPSGPVVFEKQHIDEDTEGLNVALYLSNQAGDTRTLKKFNGVNNPDGNDQSKFGKLMIKSIKLIMNNTTGSNYSDSPSHNDIGIIKVIVEKKVSNTQTRDIIMDFDVDVGMATGQSPENSGETRILSCSSRRNGSAFSVCATVRVREDANLEFRGASDGNSYSILNIIDSFEEITRMQAVGKSGSRMYFGAQCSLANNWIMTGCTHVAGGGDTDFVLYQNGCYGDEEDSSSDENSIDIRCCKN